MDFFGLGLTADNNKLFQLGIHSTKEDSLASGNTDAAFLFNKELAGPVFSIQ